MPAQDILSQLASQLAAGKQSRVVTEVFGTSPLRLTFINPRKFFAPNEKFEFSQLLEKAFKLAIADFAGNLANEFSAVAGTITSAAQQLLPEIKQANGSFYSFYINPKSLNVNHSKIVQEVLTGAGWDFDVLGDNLSNFNFSGTTGNMLSDLFTIKLSRAFFKFTALEQFYLYNNNDPLLMILDYTAYIGKMVSMNWTWDADDIYQIKYDFTWRVNPLFSFDVITGLGISTLFNQANLTDIVFDPAFNENLYLTTPGNIDVFEKEMQLYK